MASHSSNAHPSGSQAVNIHDRIACEAKGLREVNRIPLRNLDNCPRSGPLSLITPALDLERSIPARFDHEGKTYFLRVSIGLARLMVFDSPTAFKPLAMSLSTSPNEFGHTPSQLSPCAKTIFINSLATNAKYPFERQPCLIF